MPVVTLGGLPTYYEEHGSGEPFVLVHHDASSSRVWAPFVPTFAAAHRLILYDRRGQGRSAPPQRALPYRVGDLADDLEQLCRHLGIERLTLLGYSGGALASLEFALRQRRRIKALILVEPNVIGFRFPTPLAAEEEWSIRLVRDAVAEVKAGRLEAALRAWLSSVYPKTYEQLLSGPAGRELYALQPPLLLNIMEAALEFSVPEARLRELRAPVLLIGGGESQPLYQRMLRELAAWLPRSRCVWVPGADHGLVMQRPKLFRAAVREFLEEVSEEVSDERGKALPADSAPRRAADQRAPRG